MMVRCGSEVRHAHLELVHPDQRQKKIYGLSIHNNVNIFLRRNREVIE